MSPFSWLLPVIRFRLQGPDHMDQHKLVQTVQTGNTPAAIYSIHRSKVQQMNRGRKRRKITSQKFSQNCRNQTDIRHPELPDITSSLVFDDCREQHDWDDCPHSDNALQTSQPRQPVSQFIAAGHQFQPKQQAPCQKRMEPPENHPVGTVPINCSQQPWSSKVKVVTSVAAAPNRGSPTTTGSICTSLA